MSGVAMTAAVQLLIGLLVWFALRRPIERGDEERRKLEAQVKELRNREICDIRKDFDDHKVDDDKRHDGHSSGRKQIHMDVSALERRMENEFVRRHDCEDDRGEMIRQVAGFNAAVLKLERVSERVDATGRRADESLNRVINMNAEVAALFAKVEALKDEFDRKSQADKG